ncbi:MAG: formate/nitrite transporter family protein [Caldicoprobacterales bacterium]|jgi:formate/nitrite transporter|nr:formate/nitrite transporter family protein [Clostridiales bacterium]
MGKGFSTPPEIVKEIIDIGYYKATSSSSSLVLLGILAGAFIAFASQGSNVTIHTIESLGLAKTLAGALFAAGLIMVVIGGGELFTGNTLIIVSCLEGRTRWRDLFRNWVLVYLGNFIGSLLIVFLILGSGQLNFSDGSLGGFTIKTAVYKTDLTFKNAFFMGVLANWLVCMAVWLALAARDIAGKILAIFFPIWLFVTSGFEHSIANMYYIPAGILAKSNPVWAKAALSLGVSAEKIDGLNWGAFLFKNLLPVTLGNILGGTLLVGLVYWLCYMQNRGNIKHKD